MGEKGSKIRDWTAEWEEDHRNPVNRALHFYLGMPLVAVGLFSPLALGWQGLLFIPAGYAAMLFGHYVYEGRGPTIFRDPLAIFGAAHHVTELIFRPLMRLFRRSPKPAPAPPEPVLQPVKEEPAR